MSIFHTSRRRAIALVAGLVVAVAAVLVTTAQPGAAVHSAGPEPKPTIVLVHGAFADSSSWNGVVTRLQRDGYPVIGDANPLRGLGSDANYVRS